MRIAAIRGQNLASLAGEFELRLDEDPLGQVGLFAITGPTGAGKSTLLDCVCLALYDQMPRLQVASRSSRVRASMDEDAEALTATDPRLVLRRGTGEGYAEVEFHDAQGRRFRSRWSVRRAHGKAEGRVQNTELSLWAEDGSLIAGGRKREVLAAIEERVGLGFEQFLRSAMLAQGAFAAFLHAAPNDRATVLERVTGTEVYRLISQATFERFREEQHKLKTIQEQLAVVGVLSDEDRDALLNQREQLVREAERREAAVEQAKKALTWHKQDDALAEAVKAGEADLAEADAAVQGLAEVREELARAEALEHLRPVIEAEQRAKEAAASAEDLVRTATQREQDASTAATSAEQAAEQAREHEASLAQAWAQRQPELDRARRHDATLEAARSELVRLGELATKEQGQVEPLERALAKAESEARSLREAAERARSWFEANPRAELRRQHAQGLLRDLERLHAARSAALTAVEELEGLRSRMSAATTEAETLREAHARAESERVSAERSLTEASERVESLDAEGLEARITAAQTERSWLDALAEPARLYAEAGQRLDKAEADKAQAEGRAKEVDDEIAAIQADEPLEAIRLEEARTTLERLTHAVGLETRRGELVDGEPCPLCGSPEHPWKDEGAPTPRLLSEQRARVQELDAARLKRARRVAGLQTEKSQLREAWKRAEGERKQAESQRAQALTRWQQVATPDGLTPLSEAPELEPVEQARRTLGERERSLAEQRGQLRQAERLLSEARRQHEFSRKQEQARALAFQENRVLRERLGAKEQAHEERAQAAQAEVQRLIGDLEPLAGLPGFPQADAAELREALGQELQAAEQHRSSIQAHDAWLTESPIEAHRSRLAHARERASEATARRDQAAQRVERLGRERASILDGQPVELVVEAHQVKARTAREQVEHRAREARTAGELLSAATARLEQARTERERCHKAWEQARAELLAACAEASVSEEQARQRLAPSPDRLRALREQVDSASARLERARTVLDERRRALTEHRTKETPPPPRELFEAHLGQLEQDKRQAQAERGSVDAKLAGDAAARRTAESLSKRQADQAAVLDTWSRLSDLIGSRDGRTFKRFAQSLTLEALLSHANRHLGDLAPRYRLVRVPGSELDLQVVDRHMGDEIRGVHTLSGGESFLASLALALGLASLASADTPVETLFIDEGFGTLDRETLDTALAALDALRATGRQVGIISHVAGLAERIGTQVRVVPTGAGRSKVVVERG